MIRSRDLRLTERLQTASMVLTILTNEKTVLETGDIWDTDYNSDNWEPEFRTIIVYLTFNCDIGQHLQFLRYFSEQVVIVQDLDKPRCAGAFWGEVVFLIFFARARSESEFCQYPQYTKLNVWTVFFSEKRIILTTFWRSIDLILNCRWTVQSTRHLAVLEQSLTEQSGGSFNISQE